MEKQREIERGPHMAFTDLEEEYDKVPREVMLWALEEKQIPRKYIEVINNVQWKVINIRTIEWKTSSFPLQQVYTRGQC